MHFVLTHMVRIKYGTTYKCSSVLNLTKSIVSETYQNRLHATVNPAITIETMLMSFIRIFKLGPDVSLNGSPTVSPTTVAL